MANPEYRLERIRDLITELHVQRCSSAMESVLWEIWDELVDIRNKRSTSYKEMCEQFPKLTVDDIFPPKE